MPIQPMTIKETNNFDITIKENKHVVLILSVNFTLFIVKFDMFIQEYFPPLTIEVRIHIVLLEE